MSAAAIEDVGAGVLQLSGVLDYRSGPALRESGGRLIDAQAGERFVVDCGGVEKSSSVGLSLLLSFMRDAQAKGKALVIRNLPKDMREIANVTGLLDILPLEAGRSSP